jgi:hypothetical protein
MHSVSQPKTNRCSDSAGKPSPCNCVLHMSWCVTITDWASCVCRSGRTTSSGGTRRSMVALQNSTSRLNISGCRTSFSITSEYDLLLYLFLFLVKIRLTTFIFNMHGNFSYSLSAVNVLLLFNCSPHILQ